MNWLDVEHLTRCTHFYFETGEYAVYAVAGGTSYPRVYRECYKCGDVVIGVRLPIYRQ